MELGHLADLHDGVPFSLAEPAGVPDAKKVELGKSMGVGVNPAHFKGLFRRYCMGFISLYGGILIQGLGLQAVSLT